MDSKQQEQEPYVNFGRSMIVPSVQELAKEPLSKLPPRYVRDRDCSVESISLESVPVIDLENINGEGEFMQGELKKLHSACKDWGFFQVVNHGVSTSLLEELKGEIIRLFNLPMEEKKKLWQHPDNQEGFGQLFVVSENQKLDWSDIFYITTQPTKLRWSQLFDKLPSQLREILEVYSMETKKLASSILNHMAKALNVDEEEIRELFSDGIQSIRMNYYPPCPEPNKAIGLAPHSDACVLTILLQLDDTQGLEIRKEGKWVPVIPLPNAFVVNIGDIMEIVSNGIYRSIEHRVTVNSTKARLSVAAFCNANLDWELGPARSIIDAADNPPVFRRMPFEQYYKEYFTRRLYEKSHVDFMRLQ